MQGHYFIRDGEQIYEMSTSSDKDLSSSKAQPRLGTLYGVFRVTRRR